MNALTKFLHLNKHVCPWWLAYTFDNQVRRLFHKPERLFDTFLEEGMTAVDIGCGMGYFAIHMARMVGESGLVIAVDLQQHMLDALERRAQRAGLAHRIRLHRCETQSLGLDSQVDFALTFWMVHEVPDVAPFMEQVRAILKPSGKYLLVEPRLHVSRRRFQEIVKNATTAGLQMVDRPRVSLSRAALFV